ncbi:MAG: FmdB family zinc ribbon protein [Ramlibacter sp.]
MPIYAYKCGSCGHAKDVLQKLSDAPMTVCPACGAPAFTKQVTSAGFQLKGSGWYATDFKGGTSGEPTPAESKADTPAVPADTPAKTGDAAPKTGESKPKPAESGSSPTKPDTPAASAGGHGSACH